jgi:type IV secretory pathway TrbD component
MISALETIMADTKHAPHRGYSPDMDGPAHEVMYDDFVHFIAVAAVFVACCVVALAVGGVRHAWLSAIFGIVLAIVATAIGLFSRSMSWRPPAVVLVILLAMLALY